MAQVRFKQVDVFTSVRFKGNPVAVILRGDDLSSEQMQQIANWTNLSETTFVLPAFQAGADYRVRIFTPGSELPFAGHPTIGTAHALLEAGAITPKQGVLVQECKAGLVTLQVSRKPDGSQSISFTLPQASITPLDAAAVTELEAILGAPVNASFPPCLVDVGPRWIVAQMESGEAVLENKPDLQRMARQDTGARATGVTIFGEYRNAGAARIEVRSFAPTQGISEDPVCGSGNGCVAAFIRHTGQTAHFGQTYAASQGRAIGRAGSIDIAISAESIQVGGSAVTCIDGHVSL